MGRKGPQPSKQTCILCCSPYSESEGGRGVENPLMREIDNRLTISKFYNEIVFNRDFSGGGEGGEGKGRHFEDEDGDYFSSSKNVPGRLSSRPTSKSGRGWDVSKMFSICSDCIVLVKSATDLGDKVNEVEIRVRGLQRQVLKELGELQRGMAGFYEEMKGIGEIVRKSTVAADSDSRRRKVGIEGNVLEIRKNISRVVTNLESHNAQVIRTTPRPAATTIMRESRTTDESPPTTKRLTIRVVESRKSNNIIPIKVETEKCLGEAEEDDAEMDYSTNDNYLETEPSWDHPSPASNVMGDDDDDDDDYSILDQNQQEDYETTEVNGGISNKLKKKSTMTDEKLAKANDNYLSIVRPKYSTFIDPVTLNAMSEWRRKIVNQVIQSTTRRTFLLTENDPRAKYLLEYNIETGFLCVGDITDLKINDDTSSLSCSRCSFRISEQENTRPRGDTRLFYHVLGKHLNAFVCQVCQKKFTAFANYSNHVESHKNPESIKCDICNKVFTRKFCLELHAITHMTNKQRDEALKAGKIKSSYYRLLRGTITSESETTEDVDFKGMSAFRRRVVTRVIAYGGRGKKVVGTEVEDDPRDKYLMKYNSEKGCFSIGHITEFGIHDEEKALSCSQCPFRVAESLRPGKVVKVEIELFYHVLAYHLNAFVCPYCQYGGYKSWRTFRKHVRTHKKSLLSGRRAAEGRMVRSTKARRNVMTRGNALGSGENISRAVTSLESYDTQVAKTPLQATTTTAPRNACEYKTADGNPIITKELSIRLVDYRKSNIPVKLEKEKCLEGLEEQEDDIEMDYSTYDDNCSDPSWDPPQGSDAGSDGEDEDNDDIPNDRTSKATEPTTNKNYVDIVRPKYNRAIDPKTLKAMSAWRRKVVTHVIQSTMIRKFKYTENDPRAKYLLEYNIETGFLCLGDITDLIIDDEKKNLSCSRCPYRISETKKDGRPADTKLFYHVLGKHLNAFVCHFCEKKFGIFRNYNAHVATHRNPESVKCDLCDKILCHKRALKMHAITHMTTKQRDEAIKAGKISRSNYTPLRGTINSESKTTDDVDFTGMSAFRRKIVTRVINYGGRSKRLTDVEDDPRDKYLMKYNSEKGDLFIGDVTNLRIHDEEKELSCSKCSFRVVESKTVSRNVKPEIMLFNHVLGHHLKAFVCPHCPQRHYKSLHNIMLHLRSHKKEPKLTCDICGKVALTNYLLRQHKEIHMSEEEKAEARKAGIMTRKTSQAGLKSCSICGKVFKTAEERDTHKNKEHPDNAKVCKCPYCGKAFGYSYMYRHKRLMCKFRPEIREERRLALATTRVKATRMRQKRYQKRKIQMRITMQRDKSEKMKAVQADLTGMSDWRKELVTRVINFAGKGTSRKLKNDLRDKYKMEYNSEKGCFSVGDITDLGIHDEDKSLSCSKCSYRAFDSAPFPKVETSLLHHVMGHHLKALVCPFCQKRFVVWRLFKNHLITHEEPEEAKPPSTKRRALKSNLDSKSTKRKPLYECRSCGENFPNRRERLRHIEQCPKMGLCPYCGKNMSPNSLKRHKKHTCPNRPGKVVGGDGEEDGFECHICARYITFKYKTEAHLKQHMRLVHSMETDSEPSTSAGEKGEDD